MKKTQTKSSYLEPLNAGFYYHVFNRTNNREPLFLDDEDRRLFLKKYDIYVAPYVDTFAYELLGNHFHLSIRVKQVDEILRLVEDVYPRERTKAQRGFLKMKPEERTVKTVMESQFTRLFTAYAMIFNVKHKRSGNLFYRPFKRALVKNEQHFGAMIYYIHANMMLHGLMSDFTDYFWSSYQAYLSDKPSKIAKEEVLNYFGGKAAFLEFHGKSHDFEEMKDLLLDDC
jgi:putative transposase